MGMAKTRSNAKGFTAPPSRHIDPGTVYTGGEAMTLLRIGPHKLADEISSGRLRARREGKRYMILGQALLDWATGAQGT